MQYQRFLGSVRLAKAVLVGLALTMVATSDAEAARRRHHRVVTRAAASDDGDISGSARYAAYVVDDKTGRVLYSKNADSPRHPASLTKMMTLYVLFEELEKGRLKLDSELEVSRHAASQAPTKLGLRPGSTIDVEDAIKGAVTRSANDAAVVIAENIAGSEEAFARRMTETARRIGMNSTTFYNASGLPDSRQITTAHDMVTLGRALQERFPRYYTFFGVRSFVYRGETVTGHNRVMTRLEGVDGIKTGYTGASGFNLVSSLRRDGRHLVAAVLGGSSGRSRDDHMIKLLTQSLPAASSGPKVASVFAEGRLAKVSTDTANDAEPQEIQPKRAVAAAMIATVPAPAPTPVPAPAPAPSAPLVLTPVSAPMPLAPAPTAARPTPFNPNAPRIVSSEAPAPVPPAGIAAPRVGEHGAAVAMAKAILLYETKQVSGPIPPASIGPARAEPPRGRAGEAKVASLADATISHREVMEYTNTTRAPSKADDVVRKDRDTVAPIASGRTGWMIQIGAFDSKGAAEARIDKAKSAGVRELARAEGFTETAAKGGTKIVRARFAGFADQNAANAACSSLKRKDFECIALRQ